MDLGKNFLFICVLCYPLLNMNIARILIIHKLHIRLTFLPIWSIFTCSHTTDSMPYTCMSMSMSMYKTSYQYNYCIISFNWWLYFVVIYLIIQIEICTGHFNFFVPFLLHFYSNLNSVRSTKQIDFFIVRVYVSMCVA